MKAVTIESTRGRGEVEVARGRVKKRVELTGGRGCQGTGKERSKQDCACNTGSCLPEYSQHPERPDMLEEEPEEGTKE